LTPRLTQAAHCRDGNDEPQHNEDYRHEEGTSGIAPGYGDNRTAEKCRTDSDGQKRQCKSCDEEKHCMDAAGSAVLGRFW